YSGVAQGLISRQPTLQHTLLPRFGSPSISSSATALLDSCFHPSSQVNMVKVVDLPLEIFRNIIHKAVLNGVQQAWRQRSVCRAFAVTIDEAVFLTQPIEALIPHEGRNRNCRHPVTCSVENAARFLFNRLTLSGPLGVHPTLRAMIETTADMLISNNDAGPQKPRQWYLEMLCLSVARERDMTKNWWPLLTKGLHHTVYELPESSVKIRAAAAVNDIELYRRLLSELQDEDDWEWEGEASLYADPIHLAVHMGYEDLIRHTLDIARERKELPYLLSWRRRCKALNKNYGIDQGMCLAIERGDQVSFQLLINFIRDAEFVPHTAWWIGLAAKKGDKDMVNTLIKVPTEKIFPSDWQYTFKELCQLGDISLMKSFVNEDPSILRRQREPLPGNPMLHIALEHGTHEILKALFEVGIGQLVNEVRRADGLTPFYLAIQQQKKSAAQLLLQHGAKIIISGSGLGGNWKTARAMEMVARTKNEKMYNLIREAALKKGLKVPSFHDLKQHGQVKLRKRNDG
ncbi:uncharacterized protein EI97DRAFT_475193, partial [Westerdykella ornata]